MAKYIRGPRPRLVNVHGRAPGGKTSRTARKINPSQGDSNVAAEQILAFFKEKGANALAEIPVPASQNRLTLNTISRWLLRTNRVTALTTETGVSRLLLELMEFYPDIVPELPALSKRRGPRRIKRLRKAKTPKSPRQ